MTNQYTDYVGFKDPTCDRSVLHDKRNGQKTQQLFVDMNVAEGIEPLYTMRDYDHKGYLSAYQVYMHSVDERDAALKLVGSMKHWRRLCGLAWFMKGSAGFFEGLEQWRLDMAERDQSLAKTAIFNATLLGDHNAAKKLNDIAGGKKISTREQNKTKKETADKKHKSAKVAQLLQTIKK